MRPFWLLLLTPFLVGGACGPPGFTPPPPDDCATPLTTALDQLEVGPDMTPFVAWHEGDTVSPVFGGQGLPMLPMRFRLAGSSIPACIPIQVELWNGSVAPQKVDLTLRTYALKDGSRVTRTYWFIGQTSEPFALRVAAGGQTVQLKLHAKNSYTVDALALPQDPSKP